METEMIYLKGTKCPSHPASPITMQHGCISCIRQLPTYRAVVTHQEVLYYKRAKAEGTLENTAAWIKTQYLAPDEFKPFVIKGGK